MSTVPGISKGAVIVYDWGIRKLSGSGGIVAELWSIGNL